MERQQLQKLGIAIIFYAIYNSTYYTMIDALSTEEGANLDEYVYYQGVQGKPGLDFPVYSRIPRTGFSCKTVESGYYADLETRCQVFHICNSGAKISFLCPNGTIFQQSDLICEWWFKVNCTNSPEYYSESAELLRERSWKRRTNQVPIRKAKGGGVNDLSVRNELDEGNSDESQIPAESASFYKNNNQNTIRTSDKPTTFRYTNHKESYTEVRQPKYYSTKAFSQTVPPQTISTNRIALNEGKPFVVTTPKSVYNIRGDYGGTTESFRYSPTVPPFTTTRRRIITPTVLPVNTEVTSVNVVRDRSRGGNRKVIYTTPNSIVNQKKASNEKINTFSGLDDIVHTTQATRYENRRSSTTRYDDGRSQTTRDSYYPEVVRKTEARYGSKSKNPDTSKDDQYYKYDLKVPSLPKEFNDSYIYVPDIPNGEVEGTSIRSSFEENDVTNRNSSNVGSNPVLNGHAIPDMLSDNVGSNGRPSSSSFNTDSTSEGSNRPSSNLDVQISNGSNRQPSSNSNGFSQPPSKSPISNGSNQHSSNSNSRNSDGFNQPSSNSNSQNSDGFNQPSSNFNSLISNGSNPPSSNSNSQNSDRFNQPPSNFQSQTSNDFARSNRPSSKNNSQDADFTFNSTYSNSQFPNHSTNVNNPEEFDDQHSRKNQHPKDSSNINSQGVSNDRSSNPSSNVNSEGFNNFESDRTSSNSQLPNLSSNINSHFSDGELPNPSSNGELPNRSSDIDSEQRFANSFDSNPPSSNSNAQLPRSYPKIDSQGADGPSSSNGPPSNNLIRFSKASDSGANSYSTPDQFPSNRGTHTKLNDPSSSNIELNVPSSFNINLNNPSSSKTKLEDSNYPETTASSGTRFADLSSNFNDLSDLSSSNTKPPFQSGQNATNNERSLTPNQNGDLSNRNSDLTVNKNGDPSNQNGDSPNQNGEIAVTESSYGDACGDDDIVYAEELPQEQIVVGRNKIVIDDVTVPSTESNVITLKIKNVDSTTETVQIKPDDSAIFRINANYEGEGVTQSTNRNTYLPKVTLSTEPHTYLPRSSTLSPPRKEAKGTLRTSAGVPQLSEEAQRRFALRPKPFELPPREGGAAALPSGDKSEIFELPTYDVSSARPFGPNEVLPTLPTYVEDNNDISEHLRNMLKTLKEIMLQDDFNYTRPGLVVPPSVGPQTLHSLASYFANALDEERKGGGDDKLPLEDDNRVLNELLTHMTRIGYRDLFKEEGTPATAQAEISTENSDLEGQHSKSAVTPRVRQLAQVFTKALSSYLDDPGNLKKLLKDARPTEPPSTGDDKTNLDDDELLNFSDADIKPNLHRLPATTTLSPSPTWGYILAPNDSNSFEYNSLNPEGAEHLQSADSQSFASQFNNYVKSKHYNASDLSPPKESTNQNNLPENHWTSSPNATKLWRDKLYTNPQTINEKLNVSSVDPKSDWLKPELNSTQVHEILVDIVNSTGDKGNKLKRILTKLNTTQQDFLEKMKEIEQNPLTRRLILLLISECGKNTDKNHEKGLFEPARSPVVNSPFPVYVDPNLKDEDEDNRALQLLNSLYTIASKYGK